MTLDTPSDSTPALPPIDPPPRPAVRSILFVCTGNTCRSPMAEVLCRKLLADRLGCEPAEVESRGYVVRSAGVAAFPGDGPSWPAVEVVREFGSDLAEHRSRPISAELLDDATDLIAMTRGHAAALMMRFPATGPEPRLLCGTQDLGDPIGGDVELYRDCARQIVQGLERFLPEWLGK
jgi:protein-tyrosine phosphatase